MSRKHVRKVSSFDPKFIAALKKAAEGGITIPCKERNLAVALRHRLYSLRKAMAGEDHPLYPVVEKVVLTLYLDNQKGWCIVGYPTDQKLTSLLDDIDITIPDIPDLEL